ncbi:MAG: VWA domain-containing protein [Polyangiaceae bacterium]
MTFNGLPANQLLLVGGVAAGLIVVFYILKLKRRPVPVPFSIIWTKFLRDKEATSLFSQLKRLLSLLLQLALLALLLIVLSDPRTERNLVDGRNVVVLLDASASMQATDVGKNRLEEGRAKVKEMLRGLGGNDRMLLAQMDATITPLSTLTGEISDLEAAIGKLEATDARADWPRALRFAVDTLQGLPHPEIIVVSDGVLGEARDGHGEIDLGDIKLSYLPVGESNYNAAITQFTVRRYPLDKSRYEVMLEVTNTSAVPMNLELSLYGDGVLNDVSRLTVQPGERLPRFFPNLSGASRTLEARIQLENGEHDALPIDDRAYAILPERRRARIQAVTSGNMYLEAALLLDEYLDVTTISPSEYPAEGTFDVTIFDGVNPPVAPKSGNILWLNPKNENVPFEVGKEILDDDPQVALGFDQLEAEHPVVKHVHLADVNISRAHVLKPPKEDKIIGASFRGALLIAGRHQGSKYVALGFDVRESDLPLRMAWPLFLLNTINDFVDEDTNYISSFLTGSVWRVPSPSALVDNAALEGPEEACPPAEELPADTKLRVVASGSPSAAPSAAPAPSASAELPPRADPSCAPPKRTVPVDDGRAVYLGQKAGTYTLETGDQKTMFAANMVDVAESTIKPAEALYVGGKKSVKPSSFIIGVRREIWVYLLAVVLLVSAIEWLTYHRRITV